MADGIESFDEKANLARVNAGLQAGSPEFFANPVQVPARSFIEGFPSEVAAKFAPVSMSGGTPIDPWVYRFPNAKL